MTASGTEYPTFQLEQPSLGISATAQQRGKEFVVLKGSQARANIVPSFELHNYASLRKDLIAEGKLVSITSGDRLEFTQDVTFTAPSAAAAVVLGRAANGLHEWRLQSNPEMTYAQWQEQTFPNQPKPLEPVMATWLPYFQELATKLLEFETRQPEMVQLLQHAGVNVQNDEGEPLSQIDPFTFFSLILKHNSLPRVQTILESLRGALGIQAQIPQDLNGVPWSNPMGAWYFPYKSQRAPDDIPLLWRLARQTVAGQLDAETFAASIHIRHVKLAKMTQGLFWLNPEAFLALNSVNVPYLEARGVRNASKVKTLDDFNAVLDAARTLAPDFITLSHAAWQETQQQKTNVATLTDGRFPFQEFVNDSTAHQDDNVKGNMLLDRKYAPLLLELIQEITCDALRPGRSPFTSRDQFAVRIGLDGGRTDGGTLAHALLLPSDGFDGVPLGAGLTGSLAVPESAREALRSALRSEDMQARLLEAMQHPLLGLSAPPRLYVAGLPPLSITPDNTDQLKTQLAALMIETNGHPWRLQIQASLSPHELSSEAFTEHLETLIHYLDQVKVVLDDLLRNAQPMVTVAPVVQVTGTPAPEPIGFTPPPGVPLNQILYGPPGTGKTHRVVNEALKILDPDFASKHQHPDQRHLLKQRYDQLLETGQITFVTFHQSFGYEDFIEGIKPVMKDGQLHYELEDGLFLQAVRAAGADLGSKASPAPTQSELPEGVNPNGQVWRIYIDGSAPVSQVRDRCLQRNEIRIGGWPNPKDRAATDQISLTDRNTLTDLNLLSEDELQPQQITFKDAIRIGDVVLLATGLDSIGAVAVVTGDYRFDQSEAIFTLDYTHVRPVQWLAQHLDWKPSGLLGKKFTPATLQRVANVQPEQILKQLGPQTRTTHHSGLQPHVLIIDEINRGNVAKVFGELITLLEPSKRAGAAEALTLRLPLSKRKLSVPQSLYVIGTMNTADRSLTLLDAALRRRFVFHPVWPEPQVLPVITLEGGIALDLPKFLESINARIERLLSREQVIGHAYLLDIPQSLEGVAQALQQRILPLLEEYFFEDWNQIRQVLADDQKPEAMQFIRALDSEGTKRFVRNPQAFASVEAFVRVYSGTKDAPSQS